MTVIAMHQPVYTWQGSRFECRVKERGHAHTRYQVRLLSGQWPSDGDLISLCDNDFTGLECCHFGGSVFRGKRDNIREVTVHID